MREEQQQHCKVGTQEHGAAEEEERRRPLEDPRRNDPLLRGGAVRSAGAGRDPQPAAGFRVRRPRLVLRVLRRLCVVDDAAAGNVRGAVAADVGGGVDARPGVARGAEGGGSVAPRPRRGRRRRAAADGRGQARGRRPPPPLPRHVPPQLHGPDFRDRRPGRLHQRRPRGLASARRRPFLPFGPRRPLRLRGALRRLLLAASCRRLGVVAAGAGAAVRVPRVGGALLAVAGHRPAPPLVGRPGRRRPRGRRRGAHLQTGLQAASGRGSQDRRRRPRTPLRAPSPLLHLQLQRFRGARAQGGGAHLNYPRIVFAYRPETSPTTSQHVRDSQGLHALLPRLLNFKKKPVRPQL